MQYAAQVLALQRGQQSLEEFGERINILLDVVMEGAMQHQQSCNMFAALSQLCWTGAYSYGGSQAI